MISNMVSFLHLFRLQREPIYEALAGQDASTCRVQKLGSAWANARYPK